VAGDVTLVLAGLARCLLDRRPVVPYYRVQQGGNDQHDQREGGLDEESDQQDADQQRDVRHEGAEAGYEKPLDGVDVAGEPVRQVAHALAVVEGQRQPLQVSKDREPQVGDDAFADALQQEGGQIGTERHQGGQQHKGERTDSQQPVGA
jgi:hypothetical protein